jgi:hypothetical protein
MKANEFVTEKWSQKYKSSINCSDPKGFSQKAHCAGKKKNESEELAEEFDLIESIIENLALHNGVDSEVIWEDLESLDDDELYVFATTTPVMESQGVAEGDKMSSINLDQSLANTPPVWKKFISLLPPQLAREFVDERPVPDQEDIDWFTPLRLTNPQPVAVSVADLLRHPENQGTISRSPDDVIEAVNQQWGLKIPSGKKYDSNPARYRAYAQMIPGAASPSVAVDGVIIFGAGRFVAAALRGDKTMRVWDMTRKQGVAEDWQKANKKDRTAGMSQKAVNAYRRENPGSKLKTAVTTKPSKLKKGSKASKRRKSYCSRSRGQMKMHNISCAKTPDKAICKARRRWNC